MTPGTPDPLRSDFAAVSGDISAILFDFDGTLTATPGDMAQRGRKQVELVDRAPLLAPRLQALREAGLSLGIISKSSEFTITTALENAGLRELFNGPLMPKAVGLEGKAGFMEEMLQTGDLRYLGPDSHSRILLVDDDVRELQRAKDRGFQAFAAPKEGGLQDEDFEELFAGLGIGHGARSTSSRTWSDFGGRPPEAPPPPVPPTPGLPFVPTTPALETPAVACGRRSLSSALLAAAAEDDGSPMMASESAPTPPRTVSSGPQTARHMPLWWRLRVLTCRACQRRAKENDRE